MSTTGLSVKESSGTALANPADLEAWGAPEVTAQDIIIPRILVMQGMSEMVTNGDASFCDIMENLNESKLGDVKNPVEVLPFKLEKVWRITDETGKEVKAIVPETVENAGWAYQGHDEEGVPVKRYRAFRFYCLLVRDLESGEALPHMIEFKSTSLRAGKKMATQMFTKNRMVGKSPASKVFAISVTKQQNDQGTFAVMDVKTGRDASEEEEALAFDWFKTLRGAAHAVHGDDEVPF
jgi:hypothetical protein